MQTWTCVFQGVYAFSLLSPHILSCLKFNNSYTIDILYRINKKMKGLYFPQMCTTIVSNLQKTICILPYCMINILQIAVSQVWIKVEAILHIVSSFVWDKFASCRSFKNCNFTKRDWRFGLQNVFCRSTHFALHLKTTSKPTFRWR